MEQQGSGLAQVALLRHDRAVPLQVDGDPKPASPHKVGGVQSARRSRRPGPQGAHVLQRPRHDAAGRRDEEQQVDGGEPGRRVDVDISERQRRRSQPTSQSPLGSPVCGADWLVRV